MSNSYKNGTPYKTKTTIIDNPTFHTPLQVDRINGVRTYRPYMTTLEALQDKEKKKRRKKIIIVVSFVVILLIIAAVSVVLALTVFKTTSKIEDKNVPSAIPSGIPYSILTTSYPDTHEIVLVGEMRLDKKFPRMITDRENLKRNFILAVDNIYRDSNVKQYYESTVVTQLRPGSVFIFFEILIKEPIPESRSSVLYPKTRKSINIFQEETLDGQLGEYQLFPESVKLYIRTEKADGMTTRLPEKPATNLPVYPSYTTKSVRTTVALTTPRMTTAEITTHAKTTKPIITNKITTIKPPTTNPATIATTQPTTSSKVTTMTTQPSTKISTTQPTTSSTVTTMTTQSSTTISTTKHASTVPTTTRITTAVPTTQTTVPTTQKLTTKELTTATVTTDSLTTLASTTSLRTTSETTTKKETTTDVMTTLSTTASVVSTQLPTTSLQTTSVKTVSQLPDVFGDGCDSLQCLNGGSCEDSSGFAMCNCNEGYFGITCDQSVCDFNTCENGGTCRTEGMYNAVCECPPGFLGSSCEIVLSFQPCSSNPCQNSGNCTTYNDMYFCSCPYPYGGYNCESNTIGEGRDQHTPPPLCIQVPLDVCRQQVPYNTSGLNHPYRVVGSPEEASERIMHYQNVLQECDDNIDRIICLIFSPECPLESGFPRSACSDYCIDVLTSCVYGLESITQEIHEAYTTLYEICMELPTGVSQEVCIGPKNTTKDIGDPCSSNPCLNGGTCTSYGSGNFAYFMCDCQNDFIGSICDVQFGITPSVCTPSTCLNGGTCEEVDFLPNCVCPKGFFGQQCQDVDYGGEESTFEESIYSSICSDVMVSCVDILPYNLTSNPVDQGAVDYYQKAVVNCDHPDIERFLCSVMNPECVLTNALIGLPRTACKSLCDDIRLACPNALPLNASSFEQYCGYMIDSNDINICIPPSKSVNITDSVHICSNITCHNGGICFEFEDRPMCRCREGYSGNRCDLEYTNPCISHPCLNDGICTTDVFDFYVSYACQCLEGYFGANCEESICDDVRCSNGGTCRIFGVNSTECVCPEGFVGSLCDINIYPGDPCQSNPCLHDGTCQSQLTGFYTSYYCVCHPGFYGGYCQHENPCIPNPCHHSGHCTHNETGSFTCNCPQGHGGALCQIELNPCESNPCLNGGLCTSEGIRYSCRCTLGYDGENCQQDVDQSDKTR